MRPRFLSLFIFVFSIGAALAAVLVGKHVARAWHPSPPAPAAAVAGRRATFPAPVHLSYPKDTEIRAIYLTGTTAGSQKGLDLVARWKARCNGNAVVFDVKDS